MNSSSSCGWSQDVMQLIFELFSALPVKLLDVDLLSPLISSTTTRFSTALPSTVLLGFYDFFFLYLFFFFGSPFSFWSEIASILVSCWLSDWMLMESSMSYRLWGWKILEWMLLPTRLWGCWLAIVKILLYVSSMRTLSFFSSWGQAILWIVNSFNFC